MQVYLAGPINGCTDSEVHAWREDAKKLLAGQFTILDPLIHDYRGHELDLGIAREIVDQDRQWLDQSDILLAYHPRPSTGTDMEIYHCSFCRKIPVVVVIPDWSSFPSPWVLAHSTFISSTIAEACHYISRRWESGESIIDSDHAKKTPPSCIV